MVGRRLVAVVVAALVVWTAAARPAAAADRRLAFAVAGVVEAVLVRPGQAVKKGAPLARLDLRPLTAKAEAAETRHAAAKMDLDLATQNLARVKQLYDDLSTSKEELEQAELRLARAKAAERECHAGAELARWRLERGTLTAPVSGTVKSIPGYIGLVVDPTARFTPVVVMD